MAMGGDIATLLVDNGTSLAISFDVKDGYALERDGDEILRTREFSYVRRAFLGEAGDALAIRQVAAGFGRPDGDNGKDQGDGM